MVNYDWAKQEYLKLEHADKKVRLMTLFEIFQSHSVAIQKMIPLLQSDHMTDDEMTQAYNSLVDAIQSVKWEELQVSLSQIDALHAKIQALRVQEAAERKQENPDALLQQI